MFNVKVAPGTYIIAVSGGVDSMVLLDVLRRQPDISLIVAHCNHGLRDDARQDESLVKKVAESYGLPFVAVKLDLKDTSEAAARTARYAFLRGCLKKFKADAIITAHHQDDLIETAIINILRGTGWRGLAPFARVSDVLRPLLHVPKKTLVDYAIMNKIMWREDTTNTDQRYLRNYVRHTLIPAFERQNERWRGAFLQRITAQQKLAMQIDAQTASMVQAGNTVLKYALIMSPPTVASELLQAFLFSNTQHVATRPQVRAILLFTKTALPHKIMPISAHWQLRATASELIVEPCPK